MKNKFKFASSALIVATTLSISLFGGVCSGCSNSNPKQTAAAKPQTVANTSIDSVDAKKVSEAFGHLIGRNLTNPGFSFDMESVIKGMRDAVAGKASPMSDEEYETALSTIQETIFNTMASTNLQKADEFLAKNASTKDVVVVENGKLQYLISKTGMGEEVKSHGTPLIHYTGKFADGTVFGSSRDYDRPVPLALDHTIPGFSKGIVGMKEGEQRTLFIHPDLAYGTQGQLPPNSLLIFDIEVLKAQNVPATEASAAENPEPTAEAKETPKVPVAMSNFALWPALRVG